MRGRQKPDRYRLRRPICASESFQLLPRHLPLLVDLNHATLAELKALPEIGHAYAERIVRGRPYDSKRQLASRGIIPEGVYEKVAPMIIARQAP